MLQHFSRTRRAQFFKARSTDRDTQTDEARLTSIARSIEASLQATRVEWAGLVRRLDDVSAQAVVTLGNETDEYLTRDALDIHRLHQLEPEIMKGQQRLEQLAHSIAQLEFLKTALKDRFPGFDPKLDH